MPYITREDGERFVIPSYRDVLSSKQKSILKRDILILSQSYGEYITIQRKNPAQYEVAFSPDTGYLLGESIWHYFKKPSEMIYCEAIPGTTEAILVIVKSGSVYLDGRFPVESISEELIIFLTQQNNFEIYVYGDVPISQTPQEGKFAFDANSVKSFTILDAPVFPTLPLLRIYQLQLVDQVLKTHGIGVFPLRQLILGLVLIALGWMMWSYLSKPKPVVVEAPPEVNPYLAFNSALNSPAPEQVLKQVIRQSAILFSIPGWSVTSLQYLNATLNAGVQSQGGKTQDLFIWAQLNNAGVSIKPEGMYVVMDIKLENRPIPKNIYPINQIIGILVDRLSGVYPGNHLQLTEFSNKQVYQMVTITVNIEKISPSILELIVKQFEGLPLVLQDMKLTVEKDSLNGSIILDALGS